jgi:hypothetical protein
MSTWLFAEQADGYEKLVQPYAPNIHRIKSDNKLYLYNNS